MIRDLFRVGRALVRLGFERARAERCGAEAGMPDGFMTAIGPPIKCELWKGHHGNHRAPYNAGAVEWPK